MSWRIGRSWMSLVQMCKTFFSNLLVRRILTETKEPAPLICANANQRQFRNRRELIQRQPREGYRSQASSEIELSSLNEIEDFNPEIPTLLRKLTKTQTKLFSSAKVSVTCQKQDFAKDGLPVALAHVLLKKDLKTFWDHTHHQQYIQLAIHYYLAGRRRLRYRYSLIMLRLRTIEQASAFSSLLDDWTTLNVVSKDGTAGHRTVTLEPVRLHRCSMGSGYMDENMCPKALRRQFCEAKPAKDPLALLEPLEETHDCQSRSPVEQPVSPVKAHELDPHLVHNATQTVQYYIPLCKFVSSCDCHPSSKWKPFERDTPRTSSRCTGRPLEKSLCNREHGEAGRTHFVSVTYAFPWRWRSIETILANQPSHSPEKPPVTWTSLKKIPRCFKLSVEEGDIDGIRVIFGGSEAPVQDGSGNSKFTVLTVSASP